MSSPTTLAGNGEAPTGSAGVNPMKCDVNTSATGAAAAGVLAEEIDNHTAESKDASVAESGERGGDAETDAGAGAGAAAAVETAPISGAGVSVPESGSVGGATERLVGRQIAIVKQKSKITNEVSPPQPVYLEDIGFSTVAGVATVADVLVKQARTRVRVSRLKQGQAKGRHTEPDEKRDQKKVNLTLRMMLGLRVAVGRQSNPLASQEVEVEDFSQVDKYTFPPAGATGRLATPSHKLNKTFKFRDYAPKVFKELRRHFGIEESAYMLSVAGNYDYLELIANSKSGSFFFYSHDQRYIIKAMKRSEAKFFRKILSKYYEHHLSHPDSLLIQFCGMYMVKKGHKKIHFIVMKCVEGETDKKIHSKYDLKGSSLGRSAKEGEKVLKDNDLAAKLGKIHLGSQKAAFLKVAKADAEFLCSVNVMDYSMLTSIHDSTRAPTEEEMRASLERRYSINSFLTFADEATDRTTPKFERLPVSSEFEETGPADDQAGGEGEPGDDAARGMGMPPALKRNVSTILYTPDGGVVSEVGGSSAKDVYFMGIIDILQQYNTRKHGETLWKSLTHERHSISCVDPKLYYERFVDFLEKNTD